MGCHCHECHSGHEHTEGLKEGEKVENEDKKHVIITVLRLALSLVLSLLGLFLFSEEWGDANIIEGSGLWINFAIMLAAWLISGYDIIVEGFENAIKEKNPFDENMLMFIASVGAFSLRFFGSNEFFEAVMIVLLYQLGEMFEDFASERSHKAISDAIGLRAKTANLLIDGSLKTVDPKNLKIGDEILVKVGEIVPADGEIIDGEGALDMSSLTGEFVPVSKKKGDFVNSGTILKNGLLTVKVGKSFEDSTVSHIIRLVEESEANKSKADKFITKFAKIYTPIVVSIAFLLTIIPPLCIGYDNPSVWSHWIYTAVSLLVISCPCAVVVSVPLSYFAGIGLASKNGIIVKGASYFDKLNELGLLVTDKTGTLTYGRFTVTKLAPKNMSTDSFKAYLQAAESRSNHPIAKAIIGSDNIDDISKKVTSYEELAGHGIKATYDGKVVLAGNAKLLKENGIALEETNEIGTVVYLAIDGEYAGYALLNDVAREESKKMVSDLSNEGIETLMLTGDKKEGASLMAKELGISEYRYELLPNEKTELLKERIDSSSKAVAYMGDGINDAPSIALADVGIAMGGGGSDLAIENADVVIMNDDPSKVVTAVEIAKKTMRRAILDVVIALSVKFLIAILAIIMPYIANGSELPMIVAVLADTGLTAVLIVFSVSLLYSKIKGKRR